MKSVYIITQGCSANVADSEIMMGLLQENGYSMVENIGEADIIIFNTCTVKGPTESFFWKKLKELKKLGKPIIIAGCIPQAENGIDNKNKEELKRYSLIGTDQIHNIVDVVEKTLEGKSVSFLKKEKTSRLNLPKVRVNKLIEIVPIAQGCLGCCSFCKTKQARGHLVSVKPDEIIRHTRNSIKSGAKEVWLTSQDNGAYGKDIGTRLPELLKKVVKIEGSFKTRLGMTNPEYVLEFLDELIEIFKNKKMFQFLHIPVQSGSNRVLNDMKRKYTAEEYKQIIKDIKEKLPDITISTDIICGFPTETKADFENSVDLIRKTRPDIINISRYWPRPGTLAAKMKQIDGAEIKRRTKRLMSVFEKIAVQNNMKWLGWKGTVFLNEIGKNNTIKGRNSSYKQIIVKADEKMIGKNVNVKITSCTPYDLRGKIIC